MAKFIYGLGIRHVGEHAATLLAEHYGTLERFLAADGEQLELIRGIGPVMAESIVTFLTQERHRRIIRDLVDAGVRPLETAPSADAPLSGRTFVLTGTLSRLTRPQAKERILAQGGKWGATVTRSTDYVVAGASPGSKLRRGRELGIEILDEEAFVAMVGRGKSDPQNIEDGTAEPQK